MQAAHPLAVEGLLAHTDSLDAPYERLERVAVLLSEIGFGDKAKADRACRRVRAMHAQVQGELAEEVGPYPKGTRYRADDPELLMWVLFTLIDSAVVVYRRYVGEMTRAEEAAYWEDYKVVGELFGLERSQMPDTLADLDEYRSEMLYGDRLYVTGWAREQARKIVLDPPVPLYVKPLVETANFITIALLPDPIRRGYGFSPLPPSFVRKALVKGGAAYVKRAVVPFLPDRLRYVPRARNGSGALPVNSREATAA